MHIKEIAKNATDGVGYARVKVSILIDALEKGDLPKEQILNQLENIRLDLDKGAEALFGSQAK